MNETMMFLGAIGGLLFLGLLIATGVLILVALIYGYIATRVGAELNALEAMSGGRSLDGLGEKEKEK
jgi:hypothetical protein